jgi:hypothetical protein
MLTENPQVMWLVGGSVEHSYEENDSDRQR